MFSLSLPLSLSRLKFLYTGTTFSYIQRNEFMYYYFSLLILIYPLLDLWDETQTMSKSKKKIDGSSSERRKKPLSVSGIE